MSGGAIASVLLAAGAVCFVLAPLFRRDAAERERLTAVTSERQELHSKREMALAALRDLEDDRQTGKIDDDDYRRLEATLSARAVEILKRLDELENEGTD